MQAKRNQRTLDAAVQEGSKVTGSLYQTTQCINAVLNDRPNNKQNRAGDDSKYHADNRNKSRASEEGQCVRQLGLIEFVAQHCGNQTGNDAAKYTHL